MVYVDSCTVFARIKDMVFYAVDWFWHFYLFVRKIPYFKVMVDTLSSLHHVRVFAYASPLLSVLIPSNQSHLDTLDGERRIYIRQCI